MLEPKYQKYRLKLTVLTPLHVGSGRFLFVDYDYAAHNGSVWRVDEDALLESREVLDAKTAELLAKQKPANLLDVDDFRPDSPLFRYVISGTPSADEGKIREHIKDVHDKPYIPGTTLKGALRTAIGWSEWQTKGMKPSQQWFHDRYGKRENPKLVSQRHVEGDIFGKKPFDARGSNPNYDLMRAMLLADSTTVDKDAMEVVNVAVYRRGNGGDKVDKVSSLEVVSPQTTFEMDMKIDLFLFSDKARGKGVNFGKEERLTQWIQRCKTHAHQRIENEIAYCRRQKSVSVNTALEFYQHLLTSEATQSENAFWIQLGWGTGWDGKTFGSRLKADESFMGGAIEVFGMGRGHRYSPASTFPISRRLPKTDGGLGRPLGWVLVELLESERV
jgi:CRISPR-associated protein Csm5